MKNPWHSYSLIRLGMFFGPFLLLLVLGFNPFYSAIIAASLSFAISLIFLDRQRRAMSAVVSAKLARDKDGSYHDPESDLENEILDSETKVDGEDPEADQNSKA